jgi:hypothetical protein
MTASEDLSPFLEQMMEVLADDIQREIDFDILSQALVESGWTRVEFEPFNYTKRSELIIDWVSKHATGDWSNVSTKFIFERAEDATAAILRWK